ncbi:MAG TPA: hypothetical protein V6D30_16990 [Leptolyngbyaceae cyanobacterium]
MSQDVSTNPRAREPLTAPAPIQPWSAESDADKLMDELFSDIDRILEGGSKLPTETVKPEYISLQSIVIPPITMPPVVMPSQELVQQPSPEPIEATPVEPFETGVVHTASPKTSRWGWSFEKLLLATGLASLVATIILLLANQTKLTWPSSLNFAASTSAPDGNLSEADAQFINYMLRSLEVIDSKAKTSQKTGTVAGATGATNLPPVPASANRPVASNQQPTVLERVYIPVYQTPPAQPVPSLTVLPPVPVPSLAARPPVPAPSPAARLPVPSATARPPVPVRSPAARPPVPVPSSAARLPVPVPSATARPSAPAPSRAARPSAPASPQAVAPTSTAIPTSQAELSPASAPRYTLVGLQTGDRPVCLFDIDGVTQRINLGEPIGSSGWTLVAVTNEEAIIRRNGEVRSIYPGQKF